MFTSLKSCFFGILLFLVAEQHLFAQKPNAIHKKYSPNELQQDADVMCKALLKVHPVIGIYKPRRYYEELFTEFRNSFNDSLTEKQFRIKTKQLLQQLHCGHTDIMYSKSYKKALKKTKYHFPRYYLLPVNDKVYVLGGLNKKIDTLLKPGSQITKINGVAADSFYRFGQSLITVDGYIGESKKLYARLNYNAYFLTLLNYPDTITYEFKTRDTAGVLKSASFYALNIPEYNLKKKPDSTLIKYKKAKINYRFLDTDKKTAYMQLTAFSHRRYNKAYRKIFRQLKNNNTENLILDLRYNGGGSLTNSYVLSRYLLSQGTYSQTSYTQIKKYPYRKYTRGNTMFRFCRFVFKIYGKKTSTGDTDRYVMKFKPYKKLHYNNKLYVLVNGGSFSASCLVSAYLKETGRAVFIGSETGGTLEGCNAVITPYYKLPNTKTTVRIPTFRLLHDVYKGGNTGRGIIPDYLINYSFKDYFYKRDLEMEKVEELIGLKSNNVSNEK